MKTEKPSKTNTWIYQYKKYKKCSEILSGIKDQWLRNLSD